MGQPAQRQEPATDRNPHGRPLPWSLPCHRRKVAPAASKRRQLEFHSAPSNSRSFWGHHVEPLQPRELARSAGARGRGRTWREGKQHRKQQQRPAQPWTATAMTRRPWIDATHGKLEGEQEPILFLLLDDFRDFSPLHAAAMPISRGKMMPSIIVAESGRW